MVQMPNRFPVPGDQQVRERNSKSILLDIIKNPNIAGIVAIVLVGLLVVIAVAVICDLSGLGSGFGSGVMHWFETATINPANRRGFANFLKLLLSAGLIGLALSFIRGK
jgi:hypothetical protein